MEITRHTVFASALYSLWRRSTGETRTLIADAIAAYLQRHPIRKADVEAAVWCLRHLREPQASVYSMMDSQRLTGSAAWDLHEMHAFQLPGIYAHAKAILVVWLHGDERLRDSLQHYMQQLASSQPALVQHLQQNWSIHDQRTLWQ